MPFAANEGARIYWRLEGRSDLPQIVLLNSIATDMSLWDRVVPLLLPTFRVLRIDSRGHGGSDAPAGDYSLPQLARDVSSVLDAAGVSRAALAGVSLGGMVAMEIAIAAPKRVAGLALICTSAQMDRQTWSDRVEIARNEGLATVADMVMARFLSPKYAATHRGEAETIRRGILGMSVDGYAGSAAAIRDMDLIGKIGGIVAPTLVISGSADVSTPALEHGDRIAAAIPAATSVSLECAHLAPIEAPVALATALINFFKGNDVTASAEATLLEAGLANRRRVLGDEWVDRSIASRTEFNSEFQDFITRVAWHEIWGRPGLEERTRRLLVVAVTAALGRWEEFRLHVRSGLERGGFTSDELKEVLLQLGIYAGVPAANTAFAEANEILSDVSQRA